MTAPVTERATGFAATPETSWLETAVVTFAAAVLLFGAVLWTARGPRAEKIDFSVTYVGAWMVRHGQASNLYNLAEQMKVRNALFADPNPLVFEHPPFEALLLAPLAALPYRTAYLLWGLVNALIWLAIPFLLRPYAPVPKEPLGYFSLWFLFAPLGVALFQGQTSIALLLLYALTFISLKNHRALRAGLYLGLGLFKFQFVIPFAVIFLLRRRWRFIAGFLISATSLGLLSLVTVGWRGLLSYVRLLLNIHNNPGNISYGSAVDMPTLQGFVYALLKNQVSSATVSLIVIALSMSLVLFTVWRWQQQDRQLQHDSFDLLFAGALIVSLMTGSHMFTHDFSPLILALFLVAAHFPQHGRAALRLALGGTLVLFWIPPLYFAFVAWHCLYLMFPLLLLLWVSSLSLAQDPAAAAAMRGQHATA